MSSLYAPYRSVGLVCDIPTKTLRPTLHQLGTATFLTTPISDTQLHLYDTELHLKRVSKPFPSTWPTHPTHLASTAEHTFLALGSTIAALTTFKPIALWHIHDAPISSMTVIADLLITADVQSRLLVTTLPPRHTALPITPQIATDIILPPSFIPCHIIHPPTYLNKILLASTDNRLLLLNIRTPKILHVFPALPAAITALAPSPSPDVIAIATADNKILLHNIRFDTTILTLTHTTSPAQTLSFRTDSTPHLASTDASSNLFIWDLLTHQLHVHLPAPHPGGASLASYLPNSPTLLTAGTSNNAIKLHFFPPTQKLPRLLRTRVGHTLPPTLVRFATPDATTLLSTGLDRELRLISILRDARTTALSHRQISDKRGAAARKRRRIEHGVQVGASDTLAPSLPPIHAFAVCNLRQRDPDFANVVSIHHGLVQAYTWRVQDATSHAHVLSPPDGPEQFRLAFRRGEKGYGKGKKGKRKKKGRTEDRTASCVTMSPCGNYAIVGSRDGRVHCYNMQSGLHQGVYVDKSLNSAVSEGDTESWGLAHASSVARLAVDACGDMLVSAGADDKTVKFWNLHARQLDGEAIRTESAVTDLVWCKASDLLAVACNDFCIYVYDASTRKLARKFTGHVGNIVDVCFDPNGRRVLSASMDGTIRTWDLPSGRIIDMLVCSEAPTSIAMSGSGEYLASTHVNSLGISLWVDKSKFGSLLALNDSDGESEENEEDEELEEDATIAVDGSSDMEEVDITPVKDNADSEYVQKGTEKDELPFPEALSEEVATLSLKPLTHWSTLSNLQAIKERNKPIEPAKKPVTAPFFLPTVKGLRLQFDVNSDTKDDSSEIEATNQKIRANGLGEDDDEDWANSRLGRLLAKEHYQRAAGLLRKLDASGVDLEIRTMEGVVTRRNAAMFFKAQLHRPQEYELTQAHLSVFLSSQGTSLARDEGGTGLLEELLAAQGEAWQKLRSSFDSVLTLSGYFSGQV